MKTTRRPVRVLDRGGFIKVQRADAEVGQAVASTAIDELRALWGSTTLYDGNGVIPPDAYLVLDGQMVELSGMISIDHAVSEEHTSELQSRGHLVCRLLLEKKNKELHGLPLT